MTDPQVSGITPEIMAQLRADLISEAQQQKLIARQANFISHIMSLSMSGTQAEIAADIAMFQFQRGKYDAFKELIDDHKEAAEQLAAGNANINIAG